MKIRQLVVVLGDQLDSRASWRHDFDSEQDALWMAEVAAESRYVWSHKQRIALFLSAMRHFAREREEEGLNLFYTTLEETDPRNTLGSLLEKFLKDHDVGVVKMVLPGEWRVLDLLRKAVDRSGVDLEILPDHHFFSSPEDFEEWAAGRKQLRMEYFYRELRKKESVLMTQDGDPLQGRWNFDEENRESFGKEGPTDVPKPYQPRQDDITREVFALVEERFGDHPGSLEDFSWPVTEAEAGRALEDFIEHRLESFGNVQDAMWTGEPFLFHSRISSALNLKLLDPRRAVEKAEEAYRSGMVPIAAAEGFIRQILGWREYVRGVYWHLMPEYRDRNELEAEEELPEFYWTGKAPMRCLSEVVDQTLRWGYAHHIQRLMVTGLYSLLLGVRPQKVHEWYLAVYIDAVEWVELPNTLGMSQYGDGGVMASKPYIASGKYIQRMSNYCQECQFNPVKAVGEDACPFTTLYWDFLDRHQDRLQDNRRMQFQVKNLSRKTSDELGKIRKRAQEIRQNSGIPA
ncbi:cryptochrome/photolyase family protein [Puniceicoccus vermicola]|uniref:Cryptochrome/photolyase family protein n=1 Tax=Puniceicoccus vermicola TaxID=388746 RepID=A0A7X1B237_9BACT|nr:cryptochrome/photolyase family protein [Puniceicoccus vermicola]MBC2604214.1 cryptochrome/photolyase family protein [Puniceicoccus vermicola]